MRALIRFYILLGIAHVLTGCNNALYFYETEKISLTVEARPDSSQPVQGNLGIKQRVALVSPGAKRTGGEALSAISSFSFKIDPEPGTPFNPVLIQTAFVTGDAAAELSDAETAKVARAITLNGIETSGSDELARDYVNGIHDDNDRNTLTEITKRDFDKLSDQDYEDIVRILDLLKETYSQELHESLRKILTGH